MLPIADKKYALIPEVDTDDRLFSKKMKEMIQLTRFFNEFTIKNLKYTRHLYTLEQLLYKHRSITKLKITGNICSPSFMNRISSLVAKCEHLKEIVLEQTTRLPTLTPEINAYWIEALKENSHIEKLTFENASLPFHEVVVFKDYLEAYTYFRMERPDERTLVILSGSYPSSLKYSYLLEDLFKRSNHPLTPEIRSQIDATKHGPRAIAKTCLRLISDKTLNLSVFQKFQVMIVAQPLVQKKLPLLTFTSRSGKQYSALRNAYTYYCVRKIMSTTIDCSLYSDEAVRSFIFMLNHAGELWNLTPHNYFEVLSLAVEHESIDFVKTLYEQFDNKFFDWIKETGNIPTSSLKDRFLSSFKIDPQRLVFFEYPLEKLLSFCFYCRTGAITFQPKKLGTSITILNNFPHIKLSKALEFAFEYNLGNAIQLVWNKESEFDCSQLDLQSEKVPRSLEIVIKENPNRSDPRILNFLKSTDCIHNISLMVLNDFHSLKHPKKRNAILPATEIVKANPNISKIEIIDSIFQPIELEKFSVALSQSSSINEVVLHFDTGIFEQINRLNTEKNRWDLFFSNLINAKHLKKIDISHILDLKDQSLCLHLHNFIKYNPPIHKITLRIKNIFKEFVEKLYEALLLRENDCKITLAVIPPYEDHLPYEINTLITNLRRNKGFLFFDVVFITPPPKK